jgi:hypothetical protein
MTQAVTTEDTEDTEGNPARVSIQVGHIANPAQKILARASVSSVPSVVKAFFLSHQRSFSVDKPTRTSIIVMIQNRTTTWFSFQPFNS